MQIVDMHIHSDNSPDAHNSVTVLCERAVECGIRAAALTDHCECNLFYAESYHKALRQSYFESLKAKSVFAGQLLVLSGVELGQPLQDKNAEKIALNCGNFDFILSSLHNIAGHPDFYYFTYDTPEESPEILLQTYFEQLLEQASTCEFDSLAHMTYPLRYMIGDKGIRVDISEFEILTDEILRALVRRGKALEINTSGLRGKLRDTMPSAPFIRRFRELGGEFITVGSDAHYKKHLGLGIVEGYKIARECGFDYVHLYQNRTPVAIRINI